MLMQMRSLLLGCYLCCFTLSPGAGELSSSEMAVKLLENSGMQFQLEQVSSAIGAGFDSAAISDFTGQEYSEEALQRIRSGLISSFNPGRLSAIVLATLESEMSDAALNSALAWHRTGIGVKISQLEMARSPLTQAGDRERFRDQLRTRPPDENRMQVLAALDQAWLATEASVSMMIDMQIAVSVALMKSLPQDQRTPIDELMSIYKAQRGSLTAHYKRETRLSMLYTYDSVTDEELEQYAQFARTSLGQEYVHAVNRGLHNAMLEGSYALGRLLGNELGKPAHNRAL